MHPQREAAPVSGSDLIAAVPWIAFGAALAAVVARVHGSRGSAGSAQRKPPHSERDTPKPPRDDGTRHRKE